MIAREQQEVELQTEPMPETASERSSAKPAPTPAKRSLKKALIKNYSVAPGASSDHVAPDPLQGNDGWVADNEVELATEPIMSDDADAANRHRAPVLLNASLDQDQVHLDESFTLEVDITARTSRAMDKVRIPKMPYFEVINRSQTSGPLSVHGRLWQHRLIRMVYLGKQPGIFEIKPVTVKVQGKTYSSRRLKIRVEGTSSGIAYRRRFSGVGKPGAALVPAAPKLDSPGHDGVVFAAAVDREQAYVNQQVMLTIKLKYLSDENTSMVYTPPMLTGFITEPLLPFNKEEQISSTSQSLLERHYRTALFPIRPGTFSIAMGKAVIAVKNKEKQYLTDVISVSVLPLPKDPHALHDQQNLVGHFQLQARWQGGEAITGRPVMLDLTLSGRGNLNSAPEPRLTAQAGSRIYLEKMEDSVQPREEAVFGQRVYHYLVVFEKPGVFAFKSAALRAFDPELKTWKTVSAMVPVLTVQGRPRTESQTITSPVLPSTTLDLRPNLQTLDRSLLELAPGHWSFWVLQALGPLLLLGAYGLRRRQDALLADEQAWRRRQAYPQAKKALRRLKIAIYDGNVRIFYDGLTKITADYLAAKFKVPNSYISAERLAGYFAGNDIPQALVARFKVALTACEYVRYAAVTLPAKDMHALHKDLKTALRAFEAVWKQKEKEPPMLIKQALWLLVLLPLFGLDTVWARSADARFTQANALAEQGDLAGAEKLYTGLLNQDLGTAPVYFNLGNLYVRQGRLGDALLAYERAHWLAPRDSDMAYNLKIVGDLAKIKDLDFSVPPWQQALQGLFQIMTAQEIMVLAVVFYWSLIGMVILWLLWPRSFGILKRWSVVIAALLLLTILWGAARTAEPLWWQRAVVLSDQAALRLRPYPKAETVLNLPAGLRLTVLEQEEAWIKVALDSSHQGWVKRQALGLVKQPRE